MWSLRAVGQADPGKQPIIIIPPEYFIKKERPFHRGILSSQRALKGTDRVPSRNSNERVIPAFFSVYADNCVRFNLMFLLLHSQYRSIFSFWFSRSVRQALEHRSKAVQLRYLLRYLGQAQRLCVRHYGVSWDAGADLSNWFR